MATDCIPQLRFRFDKLVVAKFDAEHASSDGGAVLLKAVDGRLGVTAAVARCLRDRRQPGKVQHEVLELVRQRVFGLVCGYADCNDAAGLADDALYKLLLDRDPLTGLALASQATLSRFENALGARALTRLGHVLADLVIEQHRTRRRGRARRITIDFDPTDDPTHGQQEFTFFNGHYDTWCYLPLLGFVSFDDEAEQYLVLALLRPGNSGAKVGALGRLRHLFRKLRAAFPGARLRVRLDGGFAGNDLLAFLETAGVEYVVALGRNRRLDKRAQRLMGKARMQSKASGETEQVYGETRYAARKWQRKRRIIIKAEVVCHPGRLPKNNPRFVVTNLPHTPRHVYEIYRARGDVENRIKELKAGLALDRLSCSRFLGNQFRLLLTLAAYILVQTLRGHAAGTAGRCGTGDDMARATVQGRGLDRAIRAPHRPAFPGDVPVAADLATDCAGRRRHALTPPPWGRIPPGRGRRVAGEPGPLTPPERPGAPPGDLSWDSRPREPMQGLHRTTTAAGAALNHQSCAFTHKAG